MRIAFGKAPVDQMNNDFQPTRFEVVEDVLIAFDKTPVEPLNHDFQPKFFEFVEDYLGTGWMCSHETWLLRKGVQLSSGFMVEAFQGFFISSFLLVFFYR